MNLLEVPESPLPPLEAARKAYDEAKLQFQIAERELIELEAARLRKEGK